MGRIKICYRSGGLCVKSGNHWLIQLTEEEEEEVQEEEEEDFAQNTNNETRLYTTVSIFVLFHSS